MTAGVSRLKRLLWLAAFPIAATAAILGLQNLAAVYGYLERARAVYDALHLIEPRRAEPGRLRWLADDPGLPRRMESLTRESLTHDYLLGFEELAYSLLTGDASGLRSYFQQGALDDARLAAATPLRAEFVDWDHRLTLHFYAPDGAAVSFTDRYRYAQGVRLGGDLADVRIARRAVDVVMTLDDGTWRVHHWRVVEDTADSDRPAFTGLAAMAASVRGVNYTPRSAPFEAFWPAFDPAEVDADLATAAGLGLDTVRVFVPYPPPDGVERKLNALLELATRRGLRVIPTLLDGYTRYRLEDLPAVLRYLEKLAGTLRHPAVLFVDVKNEADRDFAASGPQRTRAFLSFLLGETRRLSGKPVLVGLIDPDAVLAEAADLVSLHHYGPVDGLPLRLERAARLGKPVLLEEFGFHSWPLKLPDPHSEAEQAWYLQQVLDVTREGGTGWLVWTLFDLPIGAMPSGRQVERHLGVVRADGRPKPAAGVLGGVRASPPNAAARLAKHRPALLVGLVALAAALVAVAARRVRAA